MGCPTPGVSGVAAPCSPPMGGALRETSPAPERRLARSAEEAAGLSAPAVPACSEMLRALPRALRLPRPWRSPGARDCASHAATGTPEIRVHPLTGPDQGKVAGRSGPDPAHRETYAGERGLALRCPRAT